jgi:hypothetical protein
LRIPLGSDTEEAGDEFRLPGRVSTIQPLHLPLPHHVYRFNAFQCPLRRVKALEALLCPHLLLDESVILLDHVVQVLHAPQFAVLRHNSLCL